MKSLFSMLLLSVIILTVIHTSEGSNKYAFDQDLYRQALDSNICQKQLNYIDKNHQLRNQFLDAGIRTPRGMLQGNLVDLGNYEQCLAIKEDLDDSIVEGKYCTIKVPIAQMNFQMPNLQQLQDEYDVQWLNFPWAVLSGNSKFLSDELLMRIQQYNAIKIGIESALEFYNEQTAPRTTSTDPEFRLAVCIPKSCTTREALDALMFNTTSAGLEFFEESCRLPRDKPLVTADYIAVTIFLTIGLLTILSTTYDIAINRGDGADDMNIKRSFSLIRNTKTLTSSVVKNPYLGHFAGVKAITVMWIIVGDTFATHFARLQANPFEMIEWIQSYKAVIVTSSHYGVDTFILMTVFLVIYNMIGVVSVRRDLFKRVPRFFLNRFRRVLPVIGAVVLLQASIFNWITDGPVWDTVARNTENCRNNWWSTMLQIQNIVHTSNMCLHNSWYFAIENQLYIQSPLIIMGLLDPKVKRRRIMLVVNIFIGLTISSIVELPKSIASTIFAISRPADIFTYFRSHYSFTLARGCSFFMGVTFGYIFLAFSRKARKIPAILVIIFWFLTVATIGLLLYVNHQIVQLDWDNQVFDSMINAYCRPLWMFCMSWVFISCATGYGGILNWFLSHKMWKVLGRLSMTMYLIHYPLIFIISSRTLVPTYFSIQSAILEAFFIYMLTALAAFILMLLVERPFSALSKCLLGKENVEIYQSRKKDTNNIINKYSTEGNNTSSA